MPWFANRGSRRPWYRQIRPVLAPLRMLVLLLALGVSGQEAIGQTSPKKSEEPAVEVQPLPGYQRHLLPLEREFSAMLSADLNGDGRMELLLVEADLSLREPEHWLKVFQDSPQGYRPLPDAGIRLPPGLVVAEMGVFRDGPGLVLLTPGQLRVWPWAQGRFHPGRERAAATESLFPVAGGELKTWQQWVVDLSGDGLSEIVVPRFDGLGVYRQDAAGAPVLHRVLKVRAHSSIRHWFRRKMMAYQLPETRFLQVDSKGWKDVAAYQDGVLYVFLMDDRPGSEVVGAESGIQADFSADFQPPEPFDPKKPWDPPLRLVDTADLNGDGHPDLVFSKNTPSDSQFKTKTAVLFYYGRAGENGEPVAFSEKADQGFFSEGFTLPQVLDLNGDGRQDLVMVNVEIGFWTMVKALIARSVTADAAFYLMGEDGRYPEAPQDLREYSVRFSLGRHNHQPLALFGDFNGDRLPDLLLSVDRDRLGAHWGRAEDFWDEDPEEHLSDYLPIKIPQVRVGDLNGDGLEDLAFYYFRPDIRLMPRVNRSIVVHVSGPKSGSEGENPEKAAPAAGEGQKLARREAPRAAGRGGSP